jgi:regulator of protease activity HflC (stomatin/prohibitin superfamily)
MFDFNINNLEELVGYIIWAVIIGFGLFIIYSLARSIRIVPAKTAFVVERLGKYVHTLEAGFHVLLPFIDKVRYKHNLKEQAMDVPSQPCVTKDNVMVQIDGVLYFQVVDPKKASYGIINYKYATIQLAQTNMRSVIGRMELDKTFEEREKINGEIVKNVDEASDPWGVKVTRYEIQNIKVPKTIMDAMEYQVKAEREKRAEIARSEGEMEAKINYSIGIMEEAINKSEGEKQKRINEAEGHAQEILAVAKATATGISKLAKAIGTTGGDDAVVLRLAEGYIDELKKIAKNSTQLILPMDLTDINAITTAVEKIIKS